MPGFRVRDRPDRNSPRKSKKACDFPARKPDEPHQRRRKSSSTCSTPGRPPKARPLGVAAGPGEVLDGPAVLWPGSRVCLIPGEELGADRAGTSGRCRATCALRVAGLVLAVAVETDSVRRRCVAHACGMACYPGVAVSRARSVRGGPRGSNPCLLAGRRKTEAVTHCPHGRRDRQDPSQGCARGGACRPDLG